MRNYRRVQTGNLSLYVEGDCIRSEMRGGFMDDTTYAAAIDNMIVVCTDAIIVNRTHRTVYLAKRAVKPMQGIWWIGGRRSKGEAPIEGMRRNFRRETGLDLPPERFNFVMVTEYLWQDREQTPQENGSHNLCHQFSVELSTEELSISRRGLEKKEYEAGYGLQEFDRRARLIAEGVHPVIIEAYDLIFPH